MPATNTGEPDSPPAEHPVEILVEDQRWVAAIDLDLLQRCANAAATLAGGQVALALDNDSKVADLNARFRGRQAATNVLSFPSPASPGFGTAAGRSLGDVILAYETMAHEASEHGIPLTHHTCHLAVHGILHLAGYDHMTVDDAERMELAELNILQAFNVPDPYADGVAEANSP